LASDLKSIPSPDEESGAPSPRAHKDERRDSYHR
jgi:hypothetical protein